MPPSMPPLSRSARLALLAAVVTCRLLAVRSFPIYDDAFITYRYALNFAGGAGLVFNPGASWEPVLGTTTVGYALLLSLPALLGLDVIAASLAINVACDALSAWLLLRLLREHALAALVAVLAFAALPHVARVSVGGMEAPLFVALALAAVDAARSGRFALAGLLAGLDCIVRPEAVMLAVLLPLIHVRSRRDLGRYAAPLAAVGLISCGALLAYYGTFVPQSARAKAGAHGLGFEPSRAVDVLAQTFWPVPLLALLLPLVAVGLVRAWRSPAQAFVGWGLALLAAYALAGVKTWGWYFYPPLATWCLGLGLGLEAAVARLRRGRARSSATPWPSRLALALAPLAVLAAALLAWLRPERVSERVYRPMREWAERERPAADGARIFASDVGAIGYFSGATILDAEGLVWPEGRGLVHQLEPLRKHLPEYVLCVANDLRLGAFLDDPVSARYLPVQRFGAAGAAELYPERARLPATWVQDYVLFRRRE
jgi:hypothetical protein